MQKEDIDTVLQLKQELTNWRRQHLCHGYCLEEMIYIYIFGHVVWYAKSKFYHLSHTPHLRTGLGVNQTLHHDKVVQTSFHGHFYDFGLTILMVFWCILPVIIFIESNQRSEMQWRMCLQWMPR